MSMIQEFKEFAVKGNAMDMAVGIIIGAAFNKVVQSIVNDLIMPPIGMAIGQVDFKTLAYVLKAAETTVDGKVKPAVEIRWGLFVNTVIEFLIVSFSVFMVVKFMNRLIRKRDAAAA